MLLITIIAFTLSITNCDLLECISSECSSPCPVCPAGSPAPSAYGFVKSLVNSTTGLADSAKTDHTTTVYKNALAAMAFVHEGDFTLAEGIFSFFQNYYRIFLASDFQGFRQSWNSQYGLPKEDSDRWEGDNAFLLLALNYYELVTDRSGFVELTTALKTWLTERGNHDPDWYWANELNADGLSDMYAALLPYKNEEGMQAVLEKIKTGFFIDYNKIAVLDHLHRAALVFGYVNDFKTGYLEPNFKRTESWLMHPEVVVQAYSAFGGENFINCEISAQILGAWKLWSMDLDIDLSGLQGELEKLWIETSPDARGLPYYLSSMPGPAGHGWVGCYSNPIVDSTCFMLYSDWFFNPFAPGRQAARYVDATDRIEAERCYDYSGVQINGGDVSNIDAGDWIRYKKIDFGYGGLTTFVARLSKGNTLTGNIEIRLDATNGQLLGTLAVIPTNHWGDFQEQSTAISGPSGIHDLFLTFTGDTGICNLDRFTFH